jgi:DNA-binding response OmpR family regulator
MPHTLLVIDDEAGIRFTIQEILTTADVRVLSAANAADRLRLVKDESPDLKPQLLLPGNCATPSTEWP